MYFNVLPADLNLARALNGECQSMRLISHRSGNIGQWRRDNKGWETT